MKRKRSSYFTTKHGNSSYVALLCFEHLYMSLFDIFYVTVLDTERYTCHLTFSPDEASQWHYLVDSSALHLHIKSCELYDFAHILGLLEQLSEKCQTL
jgi:hypothetical protein